MPVLRATSDLHLTQATASYVWAALNELRTDAADHGGSTVLVGDVFDQAHTVHMPTWNRLRELLYSWPDRIFVIAGNHDQFGDGWSPADNAGWRNCLEGLQGGSCTVISRPAWLGIGRMLPYTHPAHFTEALNAAGAAPINAKPFLPILFTHHGFKGAYRNAMNRDRDGVSCREVPPDHLIVSGHYHMPQTLGRIIYCGSPYETSFAEERQRKGWLRWADPESEIVPKRIAYSDLGAPRHFTLAWDPGIGAPVLPPHMRTIDIVRVKTEATRKEVQASAHQLAKAGLEGAPVLARPDSSIRDMIDPTLSPKHAAERWVLLTAGVDALELTEWADNVNLLEGLV